MSFRLHFFFFFGDKAADESTSRLSATAGTPKAMLLCDANRSGSGPRCDRTRPSWETPPPPSAQRFMNTRRPARFRTGSTSLENSVTSGHYGGAAVGTAPAQKLRLMLF
ncbi:hypothetical protein ISCGN_024200 [Ixodes scapularis]